MASRNDETAAALGDALVAILGSAIDWEGSGLGVDAWIERRTAAEQASVAQPG
jgi:hypothetical protein